MKFLARKCVQMKREQADKLCTDGWEADCGESECRLAPSRRQEPGMLARLRASKSAQVLQCFYKTQSSLLQPSPCTLARTRAPLLCRCDVISSIVNTNQSDIEVEGDVFGEAARGASESGDKKDHYAMLR